MDTPGASTPTFPTVFSYLRQRGVHLRASARLDQGPMLALWERDDTALMRYDSPAHHTLSLYVSGGAENRRRMPGHVIRGGGTGALCLMPRGLSTDWDVSGAMRMMHLYLPRDLFDASLAETLGGDPDRATLRDLTFFRDPYLENVLRTTLLPLDWAAPADRMIMSSATHLVATYLASRYTDKMPAAGAPRRGTIRPAVRQRLKDYVMAHLGSAITLDDLAREAAMSPWHFARTFKQATGETPHGYVLRLRIDHARRMLEAGGHDLAHIALICGFSGQSHFTARFRQATGTTPRQYALARATGVATSGREAT